MIPYFEYHVIPIGPLRIQVWGLFVALGILAGLWLGRRECLKRKLSPDAFTDLTFWSLIGAFVGARLFHVFVYAPAQYLADPGEIFRFWNGGLSSIGGFLGAMVGGGLFMRLRHLPMRAYANVCAYVLPLGYGIGRIGCFLIHDHPGTLSHSLLAVDYPGGSRLDHGLLLSLLGFSIFGIFLWLHKNRPNVSFFSAFVLLYSSARFVLDFFRATDGPVVDARYWGLTPAQYIALCAIFALSLYTIVTRRLKLARP